MIDSEDFNPELYVRTHLFLYMLTSRIDKWIAYLTRRPVRIKHNPYRIPHTVPISFGLVITVLVIAVHYLFVQRAESSEIDLVPVWCAYIGLMIILAFWIPEVAVRQMFAFIDSADKTWRTYSFWKRMTLGLRWQILGAVLLSIVGCRLFSIIYQWRFHELPHFSIYLLVVVLCGAWGTGIVSAVIWLTAITRNLRRTKLNIYSPNPQKSIVIDNISRLYETGIWTFSLSITTLMVGVLLMNPADTNTTNLIAIIVGIVGFGYLVLMFIFAQSAMNRIIQKHRDSVLRKLQESIVSDFNTVETLDEKQFAKMKERMVLHDQISNTSNWNFSTTRLSYYLHSLVLPLLVLLSTRNLTDFAKNF